MFSSQPPACPELPWYELAAKQTSPAVRVVDAMLGLRTVPCAVTVWSAVQPVREVTSRTLKLKVAGALAVTVTVSDPEAAVYFPHHSSISSYELDEAD